MTSATYGMAEPMVEPLLRPLARILTIAYLAPFLMSLKAFTQRLCPATYKTMLSTPLAKARCPSATSLPNLSAPMAISTKQPFKPPITVPFWLTHATGLFVKARAGTQDAAAIDKAAEETAVFTCVTDGIVAEVFAHHSQGGQYYQNLVAYKSLLDYPNRGRELIRNTQDYARSKSYKLANLLGADLEEEEVVVHARKAAVSQGISWWPR
jgi:hypothetical protein